MPHSHHPNRPSDRLQVARDALRRAGGGLGSPAEPADPGETYLALGLLTQCAAAMEETVQGLGQALLVRPAPHPDPLSAATAVMALASAAELCDALQLAIENAHIAVGGASPVGSGDDAVRTPDANGRARPVPG